MIPRSPGTYIVLMTLEQTAEISVRQDRVWTLEPGLYAYVGSARAGIEERVRRHRRLGENKTGKCHWHVDYLLVHPQIRLVGETTLAGARECAISHQIASRKGTTAPVQGFGSTDCSHKCKAHLYRLGDA